eukprot:169389-Pelagomonas_calceolata.AAC.1
MASKKLGQASTARSLAAKTLLNPTVLELLTPYVMLNWQQLLLLSTTAKQLCVREPHLFPSNT